MFSTDLARIRQQVREGALLRLGAKPGRKVELVSTESYEKLKADLVGLQQLSECLGVAARAQRGHV